MVGRTILLRSLAVLACSGFLALGQLYLLAADRIVQSVALPEEADDTHLAHFHRIVLTPHKRDFGTIRLLIDAINRAEWESEELPSLSTAEAEA